MAYLSPAERLKKIIEESDCSLIQVSEIPESQQIDMAGLRALAAEMKDHIGRNISAHSQSTLSASDSFVS